MSSKGRLRTEIYLMLEAGEDPMLGAMETNLVYYSALCTSLCGEQSISLSSQHPQFTALYIKSFMKEQFSFFDIFQIEFNPTKAGKHYSVSSNFTGLKSFHRKVDWLKSWYHQVEEGIRGQGEHKQSRRIHTDNDHGSAIILYESKSSLPAAFSLGRHSFSLLGWVYQWASQFNNGQLISVGQWAADVSWPMSSWHYLANEQLMLVG